MSKILEPITAILFTANLSVYQGLMLFFTFIIILLLIFRRD